MSKILTFNMYTPFQNLTSVNSGSTSTSLTEVNLGSIFVPGGTFKTGDIVKIETMARKVGTTSTSSFKLYWNTANSISSPTPIQIAQNLSITNTQLTLFFNRRLAIRDSSGSNSGTFTYTSNSTAATDYDNNLITNSQGSTLAINWQIDGWLILAGNVANATDNIRSEYIRLTNG